MDDLPPISVFTFVAELPYALPVPNDGQAVTYEMQTPAWSGWSGELVGRMLGSNAPVFLDGQAPGTRITVRHVDVVEAMPLAMATEAFFDWVEPLLTAEEVQARREDLAKRKRDGFEVVRSVVALTRFVPRSEHPSTAEMTVGWLRALFQTALSDLNLILDALGLTASKWMVSAVSPRDLPALLPVIIESAHGNGRGGRLGSTFLLRLHDAFPAVPGRFAPRSAPVERAVALSKAANHGEQPFMLMFRLVHAAYGERLAGDPARAVVDLNTAIEVMVSALITEGGHSVGWDDARIKRATAERLGFRNRVVDHLAVLLGEKICLEKPQTPWGRWWQDGYAKRNAIVHSGARLSREGAGGRLLLPRD
ncbi:MAG: hypothetical protein WB709_13600 [Solirubrobacteraceae bacterium]